MYLILYADAEWIDVLVSIIISHKKHVSYGAHANRLSVTGDKTFAQVKIIK